MDYTQIAPLAQSLKQNISRVIVGKERARYSGHPISPGDAAAFRAKTKKL